ncbi:MAG: AbrB/MazE/SpoVT family DNA-binding domain-containing protein [Clostridiales bacterium]|jgi:AbrB family looped-hinge helix DNA binding protein|nr:AbrB/MazE/SpoVT family DNA-binding domain-containing protein [Clostridiales bacterium]
MESAKIMVDNAKVMAKGQITLPKDFRDALRIETGDKVALIYDGEKVIMMNAMHYAMKALQDNMRGAAEESGLNNDDAVAKLVMESRYGDKE